MGWLSKSSGAEHKNVVVAHGFHNGALRYASVQMYAESPRRWCLMYRRTEGRFGPSPYMSTVTESGSCFMAFKNTSGRFSLDMREHHRMRKSSPGAVDAGGEEV